MPFPFAAALPWASLALDAIGIGVGADSQRKANRQNLMLQREQQNWEQMMSNTAVQRRKEDIIKAGGNPALAFTNGQEASTPSVAPARMEPTVRSDAFNFTAKAMAMAQIKNINADSIAKLADARSKKVQADLDEAGFKTKRELIINRNVEEYEWDNLKTQILRSTETSTAMQARKAAETVDDLIRQIKQQVKAGKLELDQLERISNLQGLTPRDVLSIVLQFIKD